MAPTPRTYTRLPSGHIRILVLQPSLRQDTPLRFCFRTLSINDALGEYEAISYTWDGQLLDRPLHCVNNDQVEDDIVLHITSNLEQALRTIRHPLDSRSLWADVVCINQEDYEEKSQQIPVMDQIFKGAKRVLAWLGDGDEDIQKGMRVLARLSQAKDVKLEFNHDVVKYIGRFFASPWFRRLWIVQETVLNIDLQIMCGRTQMSYARLIAGVKILKTTECWSLLGKSLGVKACENTIAVMELYHSQGEEIRDDEALTSSSQDYKEPSRKNHLPILALIERFTTYYSPNTNFSEN